LLLRPCWMLAIALAFSGCFALSRAQRDSDEDEWREQWGSEDVAAAAAGSKTDKVQIAKAETPKAKEPKAKEPKADKTSEDTAGDREQPKESPDIEQPPELAPKVAPKPPLVMYPPAGNEKASGKSDNPSIVSPVAAPDEPPKREPQAAAIGPAGPWVVVEARGGMLVSQKGKLMPAGFVYVGVNLGRLVGWRGLLAGVGADVSAGSDQLGSTDFVTLDTRLDLSGRIPLGPVRILVGLGFVLRSAFVTGFAGDSRPSSKLGLGVLASAGVEIPVWGPIGVVVIGDGRYIKDPFTAKFVFSSGVGGGVAIEF